MTGADLSLIGYAACGLTAAVAVFCVWLWNRPANPDHKTDAMIAKHSHEYYAECIQEGAERPFFYLAKAIYYLRWKRALCAQYPQFWSMFTFIMYLGAMSLLSMYLCSLPPPCQARNDCAATEASGIYIGDSHE